MTSVFTSLYEIAESIPDGSKLALAPEYNGCGCALAAVRALVNHSPKDLHLIGVPALGLQADLLIGINAVSKVECAAVTLGEEGLAPRFSEAIRTGSIKILDATCPAIHGALQASEKGVPFMPMRGVLGTDLLKNRSDWTVIDNPFYQSNDPIVLLPALKPDVALFHSPLADEEGNVWIGVHKELMTLAHASTETFVSYERFYNGNLLDDEKYAAGTIPSIYITGLAEAERGAWPIALPNHYVRDVRHIRKYFEMASSATGFQKYLAEHVYTRIAGA